MIVKELLENVTQFRSDAQDFRRQARKATIPAERDRLFNAAVAEFEKSITALERGLRTVRRQQDGYTLDVCRVLEALSQTYGSLGGTWRDAGDRLRARELYDRGNEYERERRHNCGAKDTYNMLQRLVIRILIDPALVEQPGLIAEVEAVREEIERQRSDGRNDSWALADLALARFLCGIEAETAIADLGKGNAESTFYESAYCVISALVEEGLGRGDMLGDRLETFKRLLQRKGGIP